MRVKLQPAYVMHSRPYRDSSVLLDVFTAEYGRIGLVARGARRQQRRGSNAALLQPFTPLLLSFSGQSQLKALVATEPARSMLSLHGERLFSGLYLNELLVRLLHRSDAHPTLFAAYDQALHALADGAEVDAVLRRFELTLLDELGYGFDPGVEGMSGMPILAANCYRYEPGVGLVAASAGNQGDSVFSGADLLAFKAGDFTGQSRQVAKRLLREALAVQLGSAPLRSRELFRTVPEKFTADSPPEPKRDQR
jgi:DNA repair protein RecO (recombination protein O)